MTREEFARGIATSEHHDVLWSQKYRPLPLGCRRAPREKSLEQHDHDGSSLPLDTHLMLFTMRQE